MQWRRHASSIVSGERERFDPPAGERLPLCGALLAGGDGNAAACACKLLAGVVATHGGARVASEGLAPHSHLHPLYVGGGGVGLAGPVFCRYLSARIRGLLDGPFSLTPYLARKIRGTGILRGW